MDACTRVRARATRDGVRNAREDRVVGARGTRESYRKMSTPPPPKPWSAARDAGETACASTPAADGRAVKPWERVGAGTTPSGAETVARRARDDEATGG